MGKRRVDGFFCQIVVEIVNQWASCLPRVAYLLDSKVLMSLCILDVVDKRVAAFAYLQKKHLAVSRRRSICQDRSLKLTASCDYLSKDMQGPWANAEGFK